MDEFSTEQAKALGELTKETASAVIQPAARTMGRTVEAFFYRKFGNYIFGADCQKLQHDLGRAKLKQAIEQNLNEIPEDKLKIPNQQVLLGAEFNSEFVIEEESLRDMFAKLIASACNKDTADDAHPQFSDIIRQLSPENAKLLSEFKQTSNRPIAKIGYEISGKGTAFIYHDIYAPDQPTEEFDKQAFNMQCLVAVGLLRVDYSNVLSPPETYNEYKTLVKRLHDFTNKNSPGQKVITNIVSICGSVELTELGTRFLRICT